MAVELDDSRELREFDVSIFAAIDPDAGCLSLGGFDDPVRTHDPGEEAVFQHGVRPGRQVVNQRDEQRSATNAWAARQRHSQP